jgi:hypothetical protein
MNHIISILVTRCTDGEALMLAYNDMWHLRAPNTPEVMVTNRCGIALRTWDHNQGSFSDIIHEDVVDLATRG